MKKHFTIFLLITSLFTIPYITFGQYGNTESATVQQLLLKLQQLTEQLNALRASSSNTTYVAPVNFTRDLTVGSQGSDVAKLQELLVSEGLLVIPAGVVKGGFGPATKEAVIKFQLKKGLITSRFSPGAGRVGPITRVSVTSAIAAQSRNTNTSSNTNNSSVSNQSSSSVTNTTVRRRGGGNSSSKRSSRNDSNLSSGVSRPEATREVVVVASNRDEHRPVTDDEAAMDNDMPGMDHGSSNSGGNGNAIPGSDIPEDVVVTTSVNWSDPATWGGTVPGPNTTVVIAPGKRVVLDVSAGVSGLIVDGTLEVLDKGVGQKIEMKADFILVRKGGAFIAGTTNKPYEGNLAIYLTGIDRNASNIYVDPVNNKGIGGRVFGAVNGGRIELISNQYKNWTMLDGTVRAGATSIVVENAAGWNVGDEIVITSTDFDMNQAEVRTITAISGRTLSFNSPLNYQHFGEIETFSHNNSNVPKEIDSRAEVANLTRNIKIQGTPDTETSNNGFGGHMMIMGDESIGRFQGIELYHMGQKGVNGRYPIHWHNVNGGGSNSWIRGSSVHHSFSRFMTIHKTNNLRLTDNVGYDALGHGYFIEDGKEVDNVLTHNLGAVINNGPLDRLHGCCNQNIPMAAVFWITNPNNDFINNAAAGGPSGSMGFWYDVPFQPVQGTISANPDKCYAIPESYNAPSDADCFTPRIEPFGIFKGNRVHSIARQNRGHDFGSWGLSFGNVARGGENVFEDYTAFKVPMAVYNQANPFVPTAITIKNARMIASNIVAKGTNIIQDSLVVNESKTSNNPSPTNEGNTGDFANGQMSTIYDGSTKSKDSVFIGFKGVVGYSTHHPASSLFEWCQGCTLIDSYITYPAWRSGFSLMVPDPDNVTGNPSGGSFVTQDHQKDSTCKAGDAVLGPGNGAKGIHPTDTQTSWCPKNYVLLNFDGFGKLAVADKDGSGIYSHPLDSTWLMSDHLYRLKAADGSDLLAMDVSPHQSPAINVPGSPRKFFILSVPTGGRNASANNGPSVSSLAEFNSSSSGVWFNDTANSTLYVKVDVSAPHRLVINYGAVAKNNSLLGNISSAITGFLGLGDKKIPDPVSLPLPQVKTTPASPSPFTRTLKKNDTGADVKALQVYLNTHGYKIAISGPGSLGQETELFGNATERALIKFQEAHGITPASGIFGPLTRSKVGELK